MADRSERERHAVLGAGGIGGLVGTILSAGGETVTAIVRAASASDYPREFVLERSERPELRGPVQVAASLNDGEAVDVLWISTKATQLRDALSAVASSRPRAVVPLLNGIDHVAVLQRCFGVEAVIPATIAVGAEKLGAGRFRQTSTFADLALAERGRSLLKRSAAVFEGYGVSVRFEPDDTTLLWKKLAALAPYALTTSASRKPIGFVRDDPTWRKRFEAAAREVVEVARAAGAHVDEEAARALMLRSAPTMRSSMLNDVEAGREPELDAIAGAVIRTAETHGIAVPTVRELAAQVG